MNIYIKLTKEFNAGRTRAILSGGQAVVLHRLAIMSKDGDWVIREDRETVDHILKVLESHGAIYRFGAPMDIRWLAGGWSCHFEFKDGLLRVRTDFMSRPPRVDNERLVSLWEEAESKEIPFLDAVTLIETKKTNREKDYAVIGELTQKLKNISDILLYSRSAKKLKKISQEYPHETAKLIKYRPLLSLCGGNIEDIETALDRERRNFMHANEERLLRYMNASSEWEKQWPDVLLEIKGMSLIAAHKIIVKRAEGILPFQVLERKE